MAKKAKTKVWRHPVPKKRNMQDSTLVNVRATKRRLNELEEKMRNLSLRVAMLEVIQNKPRRRK